MNKCNILAYDIEASNLTANFGIVLSFGCKYVEHGKVVVLSILDYGKDRINAEKRLLRVASSMMMDADVWLSHYGSRGRFDLNFINTRLMYHSLPLLPSDHPQIDTWRISRDELRLSSNRLDTIATFINTSVDKTPIRPEQWIRAMAGSRIAMKEITTHNHNDVLVLEEVYLALRPLAKNHPNIGLMQDKLGLFCKQCGSSVIQMRGSYYTKARKYRRYQCTSCGTWGHVPKVKN